MGIGEQERLQNRRTISFWVMTALLFMAAVALRWWRLDLMSFNYDQAAICERAMELFGGRIPFTGIVNSLGFRNAPGYVWSVLPAFFVTCNPMVATAWHGLLCASMVVPLAMIGRRFRTDGLAFLPAVFAAFLPTEILAGRNLWAQYLVTPLAAWGLWALLCALDERRNITTRQRFGAAALALLAWAMSVHYGAAVVMFIAAAALWRLFHQSNRHGKIILILPVAVVLLTILPSFADFVYRLSNPLPKPEYVLQYEARLPDSLPWWARITDAASATILNSSLAVPVLDITLQGPEKMWLRWYDIFVGLVMVTGFGFCVRKMLSPKDEAHAYEKVAAAVILISITVPVLIAGLFLTWVQPSYFAASLPAGWLALLFLPKISGHHVMLRALPYAATAIVAVGGATATYNFTWIVSTSEVVAANYYIPFRWQVEIADSVRSHGVTADHLSHLSTPTFDTVYGYLVNCGDDRPANPTSDSDKYALLEDRFFVEKTPARLELLLKSGAVQVGPELILILPSRGATEIFRQQYYAITD